MCNNISLSTTTYYAKGEFKMTYKYEYKDEIIPDSTCETAIVISKTEEKCRYCGGNHVIQLVNNSYQWQEKICCDCNARYDYWQSSD